MDKSKELPAATQAQKSKAKKVDRMEDILKDLNRDLSMTKMKSMFAVGISMIGLFGFLNSMYVLLSPLSPPSLSSLSSLSSLFYHPSSIIHHLLLLLLLPCSSCSLSVLSWLLLVLQNLMCGFISAILLPLSPPPFSISHAFLHVNGRWSGPYHPTASPSFRSYYLSSPIPYPLSPIPYPLSPIPYPLSPLPSPLSPPVPSSPLPSHLLSSPPLPTTTKGNMNTNVVVVGLTGRWLRSCPLSPSRSCRTSPIGASRERTTPTVQWSSSTCFHLCASDPIFRYIYI